MNNAQLPHNFIFGAATSAYQIEGAWNTDGKGLSIWDVFTHTPGTVHRSHNGNIACNTYHNFETDIGLMQQLGLDAYRFSVSWSRVLPNGRGSVNEPGLDYYDRLVDALLAAGITPFVTLFHWDLPQALQREMGGFAGRDCAALFADYAEVVARRLGDRVQNWITLNEPYVHATAGYLFGTHAPGKRNPWAFARVVHHQLLAHGLAVGCLKSLLPNANVGISLNLSPVYPRRDNKRDKSAVAIVDQFLNRLFLDSLFKGQYPLPLWKQLRRFHSHIQPDDLKTISAPLDFVGINYYTRQFVEHAWYVPLLRANVSRRAKPSQTFAQNEVQYTDMGWEVYPAGLYELLFRLQKEYGNPPVYITENGAAYTDSIVSNNSSNGRIPDPQRQQYLQQHLAVIDAAVKVGVNVKGYFVWSLLDNFEWAYGYDKRFGLIHVNHQTQKRTIKDSGYWYRDFIATQRINQKDEG